MIPRSTFLILFTNIFRKNKIPSPFEATMISWKAFLIKD